MTKKIGLSLRVETISAYNEKRDAISHDWLAFFEKLDFFPILIPNGLSNTHKFLVEMNLDGIVLSGGDNIGDDTKRDNTEQAILDFVISNDIPTLGVCRGMQVINNYFKGNLIFNKDNQHVSVNHPVILSDQKFIDYFQASSITVNSFHHNLISHETISKQLQPFAISDFDNTVEGFYHESFPVFGVMWHPERSSLNLNQIKLMNYIFSEKL